MQRDLRNSLPSSFRRTALSQALTLSLSGAALALGAGSAAHAQDATAGAATTAATPAASSSTTEAIVVTGTRGSSRTLTDSLSPIQLLSQDALEHTGKLGLQEVLSNALPSLTLPSQAGGNLTSITRIATLRGLNPDHVLILVNGKRRHPTSIVNVAGSVAIGSQGVDLNMIPTAAIKRIEVLTDGAAAQYGSDAIAGVINVILKDNASGGALDIAGGQYIDGDGLNGQINLSQGFELGDGGFLNLNGSVNRQNLTNRAINGSYSSLYYAGDARNDQPVGVVYKGYGIPDSTNASIGMNAGLPLDANTELYSNATLSYAKGKNWVGFRTPKDNNNVTAIYPDGFVPRFVTDQRDFSVTGGAKGLLASVWNWDLSSTYGRNYVGIDVLNSVNPTYGVDSPTNFFVGSFKATEWTNNLDVSREVDTGWFAKPLNVAFGLEHRRDSFAIGAGQPESYLDGGQPQLTGPNAGQYVTIPGTQSFPGFRPEDELDENRTSIGAYVDLEADVTKELRLGLAGRFEHYSDFGNNVSGKLSARYELMPEFAVRGAVSNGFRAPSLGQQFYSASATSQYQGKDYNVVNLPVSSAAAQALGAKPLDPEKSTNLSVGFVWKPMPKAVITVDAYQIKITDRIVQSASIGLSPSGAIDTGVATLLESLGITGVDVGRYFLNGVDTTTRGVDVVGTYSTDFGTSGKVDWSLGANFNTTKIDKVLDAASQTLYSTQVFNQVAQDQLTMTNPHNKWVLSADWSLGPWRVFVRENRFGSFTTPSSVSGGYSHQTPKWTTDLDISREIAPRVTVTVGAQNVFNVYPDKTNPVNFNMNSFNGAQIYNSASPFGLSGGNYYAKLNYSWL